MFQPQFVPLMIFGLWPEQNGIVQTGSHVRIWHNETGTQLFEAFADSNGEVRIQLPIRFTQTELRISIITLSFQNIREDMTVEKYGLFFAPTLIKDPVYNGNRGQNRQFPAVFQAWNSASQQASAGIRLGKATRAAEITWPLFKWNYLISFLVGLLGWFFIPIWGLLVGLAVFLIFEVLRDYLIYKGY